MGKMIQTLSLILLTQLVAAQECLEGALQLQKPAVVNMTSILYCRDNIWRGVCQRRWRAVSARVACRQLGYTDQTDFDYFPCDLNKNRSSVRLQRGGCNGTEETLKECGLQDAQCDSHVWLKCQSGCVDGEIRLMEGSTDREGRVEVCQDGHWGTVCNRSQEGLAEVICSLLGFPAGLTAARTFPPGIVPISNCSIHGGNLSCTQITDASCDHSMDLGVMCLTSEQYMEVLGQCPSPTAQNETIPGGCQSVSNISHPTNGTNEQLHMYTDYNKNVNTTDPTVTAPDFEDACQPYKQQYRELLAQCQNITATNSSPTTQSKSTSTPGATTIIAVVAAASGTLWTLSFGMIAITLVVMCKKRKLRSTKKKGDTAMKPATITILDDQFFTNATTVAENPAYAPAKGEDNEENPYEAIKELQGYC